MLGYRPAHWDAADIVRIRHHGLTLNLTNEIDRAEVYCKDGPDAPRVDWLRRALVPAITPTLVPGLDPCTLPFERLRQAYALATARPQFPAAVSAATVSMHEADGSASRPYPPPWADGSAPDFARARAAPTDGRRQGSNNWAVAPARSATGRPVLASDPHRAHGAPSLRYITHLVAPGLDVIGAGEPFLPGISVGHNEAIAFGLTRFYMDQEDLYVYETNPDRPEEYRYKGRWEPMETLAERIEVRGETPRTVTIAFTRHGPVLATDTAGHRAFALRAAWLDEGMAPYFGSIEYMRARTWDQFAAAMNRWGAPGENQVYADTSGNIGWIPAGLTVVRPNWDGLTPVPGDGRYEWAGYRDMDELPRAFNPSSRVRDDRQREQHPRGSSGRQQGHRLRMERRLPRAPAAPAARVVHAAPSGGLAGLSARHHVAAGAARGAPARGRDGRPPERDPRAGPVASMGRQRAGRQRGGRRLRSVVHQSPATGGRAGRAPSSRGGSRGSRRHDSRAAGAGRTRLVALDGPA